MCALAEMYIQGVSIRKSKSHHGITCGVDISTEQLVRQQLSWIVFYKNGVERPLGEISYLYVDAIYEKYVKQVKYAMLPSYSLQA